MLSGFLISPGFIWKNIKAEKGDLRVQDSVSCAVVFKNEFLLCTRPRNTVECVSYSFPSCNNKMALHGLYDFFRVR